MMKETGFETWREEVDVNVRVLMEVEETDAEWFNDAFQHLSLYNLEAVIKLLC